MRLLFISAVGLGVGVLAFQRFRLALLAFVFLYATFPRFLSAGVSGEGFALSVQFVTGVALAGAWMTKWALGEPAVREGLVQLRQARALWGAVLALYAYKVVATVLQSPIGIGIVSALTTEFLLSMLVVLAASACVRTRRDVVAVLGAVVLALVFNELWAVAETIKGAPLLDVEVEYKVVQKSLHKGNYRPTGYRAMGTFTNPLLLSAFACMIAPLALVVMRYGRAAPARLAWAPLALLLAVPAAYWTRSRSGMVAVFAVVGLAALLVLFGRVRMSRPLRVLIVALALGVSAASALGLYSFINELTTAQTGGLAADSSALGRLVQYVVAFDLLTESPRRLLLGFGVQRNLLTILSDLVNLDNYFLRTALEGGLVGLALFGWVHVRLGQALSLLAQGDAFEQRYAFAARLSWVATIISMMFVSIPYNYLYFYLLVALTALLPGTSARWHRPGRGGASAAPTHAAASP